MIIQDIQTVFWWWLMLFLLGASILPLSTSFFSRFLDKGYIFSKILSIAVLSYISFILGIFHIVPFSRESLLFLTLLFFCVSYTLKRKNIRPLFSFRFLRFVMFEELVFFLIMTFWVGIRAYNPEIHGLEKYMDFGFMNSILRAEYFPPKDMWLTPFSINYYYFGHLYSAVLTKLSGIPSHMTYNLILGMVTGLCFTASLSLGMTLIAPHVMRLRKMKIVLGGLLSGFLVTFAGNLHTIYTLFKPYENEHPVPPWKLEFSPLSFPNSYWYPNATRFIYNTIHEFPIYSWVVADLHGHVLDIPFVLLTIALLYSYLINSKHEIRNTKQNSNIQILKSIRISDFGFRYLLLISFLLAVMYMTNAWDGLIYLLLTGLVVLFVSVQTMNSHTRGGIKYLVLSIIQKNVLLSVVSRMLIVLGGFVLFALPFSIHFKPFVSGIGVLCAPEFLTKLGSIGPFLFETNHCQHSLWWQLVILYGFFFFFIASLFLFLRQRKKTTSDVFVFLLIALSLLLLIIPEFLYAKDIYPAHYRANTMFKLAFQAFMMLSLVSGYTIFRVVSSIQYQVLSIKYKVIAACFLFFVFCLLAGVFVYPYYATTSYYNNIQNYQGIDGTTYLKNTYPSDFAAIEWIQENIKGQPVILEAQGDSYTDHGRVSTNTGLPTVLGWTVHEWLWRGQYDYEPGDEKQKTDKTPYYPAPRIGDVQSLYESTDLTETQRLLRKYNIEYIFLGDLERQKYLNMNEQKWDTLGDKVFENGTTKIYKI